LKALVKNSISPENKLQSEIKSFKGEEKDIGSPNYIPSVVAGLSQDKEAFDKGKTLALLTSRLREFKTKEKRFFKFRKNSSNFRRDSEIFYKKRRPLVLGRCFFGNA
jgi:hypothetical protein